MEDESYTWSYPKRILVDFDETITDRGAYSGIPLPQKRVREQLSSLKEKGFIIAIYSCRNNPEIHNQATLMQEMVDFLAAHRIPYDEIIQDPKPLAWLIIDDRAIGHQGDWEDTYNKIMEKADNEGML